MHFTGKHHFCHASLDGLILMDKSKQKMHTHSSVNSPEVVFSMQLWCNVLMADSALCCWTRASPLCFSPSVTHVQCFGSQSSIRAQTGELGACIGLSGPSGGHLY